MIKEIARRSLPPPLYRHGAKVWRRVGCSYRSVRTYARLGVPHTLLYFGVAPGDDLLCTAVLRELRKRGRDRLWMMSNHPDLFKGNKDVLRVVPLDSFYKVYVKRCKGEYRHLEYAAFDREADRSTPTSHHVIAELCLRAGITGAVALRPYFFLSAEESSKFAWAAGKIAIQSSGLAARWPMKNKEWFPQRFQEVVDHLRGQFDFVQIGSLSDPPLRGVKDVRGQTSRRETAAILAHSRVFIGLEGFVMHLARAVECPAVIILGGRTAPSQFCYSCNANLYSRISCAPCWLWNRCDSDRACMSNINAEQVVEAVRRQLARPRDNLHVDTAVI